MKGHHLSWVVQSFDLPTEGYRVSESVDAILAYVMFLGNSLAAWFFSSQFI